MTEDEMTYIEGGKFSWSSAKTIAYTAIGYVIGKFVSGVTTTLISKAVAACASWVSSTIETVIIGIMCYPGKAAAIAFGVAALGVAGVAIYKKGKSKGYWA